MAIEVQLEKYGHKKKRFLGFSWTAFFFNFFVPLFRGDFVGLFIFIFPYLLVIIIFLFIIKTKDIDENTIIYFTILAFILYLIPKFVLPFIYNKMYTKKLLREGYLPPKDDDYSNAILKGNRYLEYTNEDLLDKEKMERYRLIIEEYEKERKKENISVIMFFSLLGLLFLFFFLMASF